MTPAEAPDTKSITAHASDCAVHNEPAFPAGPCDCRAPLEGGGELRKKIEEKVHMAILEAAPLEHYLFSVRTQERSRIAASTASAILSLPEIASHPAPEGGWKTIDSAPKDGSEFLAICATAYDPQAAVAWWRHDGWAAYSRPEDKWSGGVHVWFPTHWQRLPGIAPTPAGGE